MDILLHPVEHSPGAGLQAVYDQAVSDAAELFIVSAYLTDWHPAKPLSRNCQELTFLVGTDFGLTRKAACQSVLNWLPQEQRSDFLAADHLAGFHPKLYGKTVRVNAT
jgi:hypothetical protein